ncbi:MAG: hypothetical protein J0L70_26580 [Leptolyngbya sp. UWPOB_LEPTO1]|uniref:hypothetical protein n=1 Tax=Leptolyngbya sp. UWPOB_LEPTO1 TaxID=2815653 RepID=UPI001AC0E6B3|nr:hypothetical protein [Leptolyngbya sp. UWPOB_LEPTO1]MBN8564107.1 hypothetical protein [Leptolyngbya sp. UWPOB_LEPTO1]
MKSTAIVPFKQNNSALTRRPQSQRRGIHSNVLPPAANVAGAIDRYFGINLNALAQMSDQQWAEFADRAREMKRLREVLPILDRHFQELIEGQLEYEQFVQKFLKLGGAAAQKIDKGILDAYLLSLGYNNHLKLMSQQSVQGSQKLNAEFQSAFSLNELDFQTSLKLVQLRRQNRAKQIRERVPNYLKQQQISEQQRRVSQQRKELLTNGTQSQRGGFFGRIGSFFSGW